MITDKIFRAYDIRGTYPDQLDGEIAYKVARAFVQKIKPKKVVVGRDIREASEQMHKQVIKALVDSGVQVYDAGRLTNPMIGFAVFHYGYDGGIILSASHNPIGYGGIKMFKKNAVTIPGDDAEIKKLVLAGEFEDVKTKGSVEKVDIFDDYAKFVRAKIDLKLLKQLKVLFDTCHGSVGLVLDRILEGLPVERVNVHIEPDKKFGGLSEPNPLNPTIREAAEEQAKDQETDFGVMWDGDGDRVFFLDEKGNFIDAPYITAVLVEAIAKKHPKAGIISDPRIIWPIAKAAAKVDMKHFISASGYRFIKEAMMKHKAVFGAEMTAHYFFEETKYMDNGIIPVLMIWELISTTGKKLSELVAPYQKGHFMIPEKKFQMEDVSKVLTKLKKHYKDAKTNELDGLTIEYPDWRCNFRPSNTEPVAKLNAEAKDRRVLDSEVIKLTLLIEKA